MKTLIKITIITLSIFLVGCTASYTCPTYADNTEMIKSVENK